MEARVIHDDGITGRHNRKQVKLEPAFKKGSVGSAFICSRSVYFTGAITSNYVDPTELASAPCVLDKNTPWRIAVLAAKVPVTATFIDVYALRFICFT